MTETVKHTPGPWAPYRHPNHSEWQIGCGLEPEESENDGHYEFIVGAVFDGIGDNGDESAANALLIAAAPDMLEALIMVRDADDDCKKDGLPSMPPFARAKLDAAIAKAEGRS